MSEPPKTKETKENNMNEDHAHRNSNPHPQLMIKNLVDVLTDVENHNTDRNNFDNMKKWSLADDENLSSTLESITSYMHHRINSFSESLITLEESTNRVSNRIQLENVKLSWGSDTQFMEHRVKDDDDNDDESKSSKTNDSSMNNSNFSTAQNSDDNIIQAALNDGMNALSLFLDPSNPQAFRSNMQRRNATNIHNNNVDTGVVDSCYYYDSIETDEFNHRPLPYVIGSIEFNESVNAGLGSTDQEL